MCLTKLCLWGQKWPILDVMFYIGLYREYIKKIFLSETTRQSLDIMYVVSSSKPLPSLFKLCFWRPKKALPRRSRILLKSYTPRSAAQDSNCFHAHNESILIFIFFIHVDPDQLSPMKTADQNPQCFHPHIESIS